MNETLYLGQTAQQLPEQAVRGEYVSLLGQAFYRILNYDALEPFFMSLASSSDHWLFAASTGGLSAGRGNPDQALFPYYTVDRLTEDFENTGPKTILLVRRAGRACRWEPFSIRGAGLYRVQRSLYKNTASTAIVFEERNLDLELTFRYAWRASNRYGLVRTAWLINQGDAPCAVELADGLQNILPANVTQSAQSSFSCLLDAYKRNELDLETGLAIFALSATMSDLAEPSESLLATTVFQIGLEPAGYLLSGQQFERFRQGRGLEPETDVRGQRGAYFAHARLELGPGAERSWHMAAEVNQDSAAVVGLLEALRGPRGGLLRALETDLDESQAALTRLVASADGLQHTHRPLATAHHFANVMFNVMRGGLFADGYWIETADFAEFVAAHNRACAQAAQRAGLFAAWPARLPLGDLLAWAAAAPYPGLARLSGAYLPLTFSRRHGDPSRPWNRFDIQLRRPDGSRRLGYEGNWRDIFQNWEALAFSYPEFVESMLSTFLNATTADGYNPYRITERGVDWEVPEPDNPWSNIGYWSDHQIIYLQKLMEASARYHPGRLQGILAQPLFSYARVPYRIRPYPDLLADPHHTIDFDWDLQRRIEAETGQLGLDGKLLPGPDGQALQAPLAEKLLTLLLAKLANFVPEGGIWMNTQRPEWNDANNALAGKGLSVVTLGYLRRYAVFCRELLAASGLAAVPISREVHAWLMETIDILRRFQPALAGAFDDAQRRAVLDALGQAGSRYRLGLYADGLSGERIETPLAELTAAFELARQHFEHALRANRRDDHLYHAYNILHLSPGRAGLSRLAEMLEGQVAILSSGLLSDAEALKLLESLRRSRLYRADQHSYLLYPDRELPGFLQKNCLTADQAQSSALFAALDAARDTTLVARDARGVYHFSGHIRNARDVRRALQALERQPQFADLAAAEADRVLAIFEAVFQHDAFTGRSGTFFAYEGLGSVYWHMVSKLLLAVQETALRARPPAAEALKQIYADVRAGLGFNKTPEAYGAFPADPYSHTPAGQGARQPGMTGLVKEEILARQAELGWSVQDGCLAFSAWLLDPAELLPRAEVFDYLDVDGRPRKLEIPAGALAYTICQTPVVLQAADRARLEVHLAGGQVEHITGGVLDPESSRHIFARDGAVHHLVVCCPA